METLCYICTEKRSLTIEHIIPQAIGGSLKKRLYCKVCNQSFGTSLDNEISNQIGWIVTLLKIKRERGKAQPYEVKTLESGTILLCDGASLKRKDPVVKKESQNGKKLDFADVIARSEQELQKICTSIKKRYVVPGAMKTFQDVHPGPTAAEHVTTIDNAVLRRAASKIAYGFLCTRLPQDIIFSESFEAVRKYIESGEGPALACANYVHTKFMTDRVRPLHKIHVALDRDQKLLIGFVSLFGIYRFTVLLAEGFESALEWPGLDYTFDPVRRSQVIGNENFRAPRLTREGIVHPAQSRELVETELRKGYKVIENYADSYRFVGGSL